MPFQVVFNDSVLAELAANKSARSCHGQALEKKFRQRMQHITTAVDERDFYALKSLHYEKLKGNRDHQYSMKLNDQYRLIVEYKGDPPNRQILIMGIEDYH
jgi:proteic killer suppression protein